MFCSIEHGSIIILLHLFLLFLVYLCFPSSNLLSLFLHFMIRNDDCWPMLATSNLKHPVLFLYVNIFKILGLSFHLNLNIFVIVFIKELQV